MHTLLWTARAAIPLLVLFSSARGLAEEKEAWGSTVSGIRLGLALSPARTAIPAELTVTVTLQNTTTVEKTLPIETCGIISWPSYGRLHVRADGGKTYRLRLKAMIDIASLHDHGPQKLAPGQSLTEQLMFDDLVQHLPYADSDMELTEKLRSARQIEVWAEFGGEQRGVPHVKSAPLRHNFSLTPLAQPLGTACVAQLTTLYGQVCALNRVGTPHCWGDNAPGWNPDTKRNEESHPHAVRRLQHGVRELGQGTGGLCALTTSSGVLCLLGGNTSTTAQQVLNPVRITGLPDELRKLWVGVPDACVQAASGALWCWGRPSSSAATAITPNSTPATEMTALGTDIEEVVMGSQHACARKKDGAVWCWGDNSSGQLGHGDLMPNDSPSLVRGIDSQPQKLVAGRNFACVLGRDHKVYCWGKSEIGALGKLGLGARPTPFLLSELGTETAALYAAHDQLCAHTTDGKLLCQGLVAQNGGALTSQTPLLVDGLPRDVAEVSFGLHDACARMQSGALWCWGERLRQSDTDPNVKVKRPPGPQLVPGLSDVASVHLGDYYLCARSKTGSVYCWGDGTGGALGAGRITVSERPIRVPLSCTE